METWASAVLIVSSSVVAIPVAILLIEILAATAALTRHDADVDRDPHQRVAVLVPAHNESQSLRPTLADILGQIRTGDRLLVVADNCNDDTAAIATAAGALVVERNDPARRGKGYALDFGLKHLGADPPDVILVIDADCRLESGALNRLAATCALTQRPVQALYLMASPNRAEIDHQVAEVAWLVKNWLRPLGLRALGLPCQLVGTGMAFPWSILRSANLAHPGLVEDVTLGLDLAAAGHPPIFCPSARVSSEFASTAAGAGSQRARWEQGHIGTIAKMVPQLFRKALVTGNVALLALTLDIAVPPLVLLALLVAGMLAVTGAAWLVGLSSIAFLVSGASLAGFGVAMILAWSAVGRRVLPLTALMSIIPYVLIKLPLYRQIISGRGGSQWIRTDRTKPK